MFSVDKIRHISIVIQVYLVLTAVSTEGEDSQVPLVQSKAGIITGDRTTVSFRGDSYTVDRFLGIPYAKAPVKELRFKKPEPYGAFVKPFHAVQLPPSCPQYEIAALKQSGNYKSEDCLFLNVYVPRQKADKESGHAVMFFIHGGGFTFGSSVLFRAEVLASVGNVIVVTINYRLGLLGFLDLDDPRAQGNFGFWDQRLAMQWVNEHINAFGGDKDRVTIFGESAGSVSVAFHMLYPPNKGLFRAAITESGAPTIPNMVKPNNIESAKYFAENMSCKFETKEEILQCLMEATADRIVQVADDAVKSADVSATLKVGMAPTVDDEFISMLPSNIMTKSRTEHLEQVDFLRSIKLINGINGAEGGLFLMMLGDREQLENLEVSREQMTNHHVPSVTSLVLGTEKPIPDLVKTVVESAYTNWENPDDPKRLRKEMVKAYGDIYFGVPGIELSQLHSNGTNAGSFLYHFIAFVEHHFLSTPAWMGTANHGDEMPAVFGYNFDYEMLANLSNYIPPDWELDLSARMMTFWSNFAKSGNPNTPVATSSLSWPKYDIESQRHMIFDQEDSLGQYLHARDVKLWRNIVPELRDELTRVSTLTSHYTKSVGDSCEKDGGCN